jgi:sugar porter (SP) family MFS transporter
VIGGFAGGPVIDRFGRRLPLYLFLVGNIAFVFLEMFATSLGMLVSGALLNGVCYGFYFVIVPTYSAEVVPHHLRNITVAFTNMCLIAGQLLGQGVTSATQGMTSDYAFRIPFALQWIWAVVILAGLWKCPESPWYLVHKGRLDLAETSLRRLAISKDPVELSNVIAMMEKTNRLEREYCETTSYLDCFKGTNLRRTEIATVPFTIQIISCNIYLASSTYFLSLAGLASSEAFYMGLGSYALAFCGNLACYPLMNFVGRRKVFLLGSLTVCTMLFIVGFIDLPSDYNERPALPWAEAILLIVGNGIYSMTMAPVSWIILSETGTTRLRSKTVSISVGVQVIASVPIIVGIPYQLNPTEAFWRGKNGFLYGGFALIGAIWAYFRLPELKGRTYEEMDILFEQRIPARDFAKTVVHIGTLEEKHQVRH